MASRFPLRAGARKALTIAGVLLTLASLAFVGLAISRNWAQLVEGRSSLLPWLAFLMPCYALMGYLLSESWRHLLAIRGGQPPGRRRCYRIYARSQIQKYVPGNVMQFASRQVMGRESGLSNRDLAMSVVFELGSLAAAGASLAAAWLTAERFGAGAATASCALLACIAVGAGVAKPALTPLLRAFTLHIGFFLLVGLLFLALLKAGGGASAGLWALPEAVGVTAAAWVAGMVTPGSPSGLGIRETLQLTLLGQHDVPATVAAVVALRLVTLGGDVLFFLLAGDLFGRAASEETDAQA